MKRWYKFTKVSETAVLLRYWSCDICLEVFLCLVAHDPPLRFFRSVHSGVVKGEMSNPIILTEVFGELIFNRILPQLVPSTTLALYVLWTCSNSLDSRYGILLSCKCMSSQHIAMGIWTAVNRLHSLKSAKGLLLYRKIPSTLRKLLQQHSKAWSKSLYVIMCTSGSHLAIIYFCFICVRKSSIPSGYCGLHQHYSCLFPGLYKLGKSPCVQPILGVSLSGYCQGASISSLGRHIAVT